MHGFTTMVKAYEGKHCAYVYDVEQRKPTYRQSC